MWHPPCESKGKSFWSFEPLPRGCATHYGMQENSIWDYRILVMEHLKEGNQGKRQRDRSRWFGEETTWRNRGARGYKQTFTGKRFWSAVFSHAPYRINTICSTFSLIFFLTLSWVTESLLCVHMSVRLGIWVPVTGVRQRVKGPCAHSTNNWDNWCVGMITSKDRARWAGWVSEVTWEPVKDSAYFLTFWYIWGYSLGKELITVPKSDRISP